MNLTSEFCRWAEFDIRPSRTNIRKDDDHVWTMARVLAERV